MHWVLQPAPQHPSNTHSCALGHALLAGPNMTWDLNDICKRITLDTITGWGFDSKLNVRAACPAYLAYPDVK